MDGWEDEWMGRWMHRWVDHHQSRDESISASPAGIHYNGERSQRSRNHGHLGKGFRVKQEGNSGFEDILEERHDFRALILVFSLQPMLLVTSSTFLGSFCLLLPISPWVRHIQKPIKVVKLEK